MVKPLSGERRRLARSDARHGHNTGASPNVTIARPTPARLAARLPAAATTTERS